MSTEQIDTFLLITGVSDGSIATQFLEMSGGDLDTAVSLYFEHGSSLGNADQPMTDSIPLSADADEELANRIQREAYQDQESDIRAPIQSTVQRLVDDVPSFYPDITTSNVQPPGTMFMGNGPSGIFNQTFGFEPSSQSHAFGGRFNLDTANDDDAEDDDDDEVSDEELVQETDSEGDITYTRRRVVRRRRTLNNGTPQQTPHQRRLAQLFSPPWDLISKYDLNMAKNIGRQTKKWIIVNIQDTSDFQCQRLNRDLWSNSDVKEIVRENFIFLQYHKDSVAGQDYIAYYPFSGYPHIAILDPKTGERVKMWSEVPEVKKYIEELVDFLSRFSLEPGHVNPIVQHKTKIDPEALSEEQQMELAIRKSLGTHVDEPEGVVERGDNENPIVLDSDEDYSEFEEISDDDDDNELDHKNTNNNKRAVDDVEIIDDSPNKTTIEQTREENLDELTDEEVFATILPVQHSEPENDPLKMTRIQIRSGDGSRVVRRFNKNDKVKEIYEYIKNDFESVKDGIFFTLTSQRANLIRKLNDSLEDAGLLNAAILLEIE